MDAAGPEEGFRWKQFIHKALLGCSRKTGDLQGQFWLRSRFLLLAAWGADHPHPTLLPTNLGLPGKPGFYNGSPQSDITLRHLFSTFQTTVDMCLAEPTHGSPKQQA